MAPMLRLDASARSYLHKKGAGRGLPFPTRVARSRLCPLRPSDALGQLATLLVAEPTMISPVVCNVPPMI
jgi:hypothetical protein